MLMSLKADADIRKLGIHMARTRDQEGSLRKVGKKRKKWLGLYHVYVRQPDGTEKRLPRTKILCDATESKIDARKKLLDLIVESTKQPNRFQVNPLTADATFATVWGRYRDLKQATWGTAARKAIVSLFEGDSE